MCKRTGNIFCIDMASKMMQGFATRNVGWNIIGGKSTPEMAATTVQMKSTKTFDTKTAN